MAKKSIVITDGGDAQVITDATNLDNVATIVTAIEVPQISTADDAAGGIMDNAPEVQPHVVEQHTQKQASAPKDESGEAFDSAVHSVGSDGQGIRTAKGLWRRKRGAGAAKGGAKSTIGKSTASAGAATPTAKETAATAAGRGLAQMTFMMGRALGGEEWNPLKALNEKGDVVYDEESMMTDAWTNYCLAKDMTDVPPGLILCVALTSYAAPRFRMPETKKRAETFKEKVVMWWVNRKVKKEMRKQARADARNAERGV